MSIYKGYATCTAANIASTTNTNTNTILPMATGLEKCHVSTPGPGDFFYLFFLTLL